MIYLRKKAAGEEMLLTILKEYDFFHFLTKCINEAVKNKKSPGSLNYHSACL